jgi:site-specific recombinase XerC
LCPPIESEIPRKGSHLQGERALRATSGGCNVYPDAAWILVHGKGRKQREVALGKKARLALSRYLHRERQSESSYVFVGKRGPR